MAAYVEEKTVGFVEPADRACSSSSARVPLLRDLSQLRVGSRYLDSPKTDRRTPKVEVIDLEPCFQAVRVVDGCAKRSIDGGGYLWDVKYKDAESPKTQETETSSERRVHSDGVEVEKRIAERKGRIRELMNIGIPISKEDVERLVISVDNKEDKLCDNTAITYPALFRLNLRVQKCFLQVHTRGDMLFVILDKENPNSIIAKGSFKSVYRAWHIKKPQVLAYAIARLDNSPRSVLRAAMREEKYLSLFTGKTHSVDLRSAFYYPDQQQVLIMKYYTKTLFDVVDELLEKKISGRWFSDRQKLTISIQILETIAYLNNNNVLHRDVKPENFLLNGLETVITDYGFACDIDDKTALAEGSGSMAYISYEMVRQLRKKPKVVNSPQGDVWGAGCLLWILFAEKLFPWFNDLINFGEDRGFSDIFAAEKKMVKLHRNYKPKSDQPIYTIVWKMLHLDPLKRIPAAEAAYELKMLFDALPSGHTYKAYLEFPDVKSRRSSSWMLKTIRE